MLFGPHVLGTAPLGSFEWPEIALALSLSFEAGAEFEVEAFDPAAQVLAGSGTPRIVAAVIRPHFLAEQVV